MKSRNARAAFAVLATMSAQVAWSAPASDGAKPEQISLSQCVALRTTGADRISTARWMFAAIAKSPQIADLASVQDQRKVELDKAFGQIIVRIVNKDCFDQVQPIAAESVETAFRQVGEALGKVAMQELLGNPEADKSLSAYADYLSAADFKPLIDSIAKDQSK